MLYLKHRSIILPSFHCRLFINLGRACGWQGASLSPWPPPPRDSAQMGHLKSFPVQVCTCPKWKPPSLSPLSPSPLSVFNLSASKFWVELGASVSFIFGKRSNSSKQRKKGGCGRRFRKKEGGSLVKQKGLLETGPQHGVAQRRKNTSFDVLRVSGVKAEFEMNWACSGDTRGGQMDSFPGKIVGSLGHWRLSSRRKGLMVTCYPHSFSFWLVWAPVLSSSWKHFVNRLYPCSQ